MKLLQLPDQTVRFCDPSEVSLKRHRKKTDHRWNKFSGLNRLTPEGCRPVHERQQSLCSTLWSHNLENQMPNWTMVRWFVWLQDLWVLLQIRFRVGIEACRRCLIHLFFCIDRLRLGFPNDFTNPKGFAPAHTLWDWVPWPMGYPVDKNQSPSGGKNNLWLKMYVYMCICVYMCI